MIKDYIIRHATMDDLDAIAELEAACFPKEEAATKDSFYYRLKVYPECFWLLMIDGKIVSMVNYYEKFGFINEGLSKSKHGGVFGIR